MKIRLNDLVLVSAGKYRGKNRTCHPCAEKCEKIIVEKINMRTKHIKKTGASGTKNSL